MQEKQRTKTFFLTGGGTGGHIYPVVSILNELRNKGFTEIYYIGNKNNPEFEIAKNLEVNFLDVPLFGMPRKLNFRFFWWCFLLILSILKCLCYAVIYSPKVVFATGGYVSAPMVIAAQLLQIPYVMHDSDAHPGIVTKTFARKATAVNLAFEGAEKLIKGGNKANVFHFKNPVRDEFFNTPSAWARLKLELGSAFTILIMGGSQGARTINNAAIKLINHMKDNDSVKIILQTGKKNYDEVKKKITETVGGEVKNLILEPYFEKMYIPLLAADLVISRAGSLSISEILAAKKPSVLVPYPYAAADHQRKNAQAIESLNAAIAIEDSDIEAQIIPLVEGLMAEKEMMNILTKNASKQITENPTGRILELILTAADIDDV